MNDERSTKDAPLFLRHPSTPAGLCALTLCLGGLLIPTPVRAEGEELPTAEQVIENFIKATGGRAAYEKFHNRLITGYMEFLNMGMKMTMTRYEAKPSYSYVELESESVGRIRSGSNGEVAWEVSPFRGAQVKKGEEKALVLREGVFNATLRWKDLFERVECVGMEPVGDRPCYKVVFTPKNFKPLTQYYDKETYLLVKSEFALTMPMGTFQVATTSSDYRDVDGIKMAFRMEQTVAGQTRAIVIERVEHNVDIPKSRLELPEEIQTLLAEAKPRAESTEAPQPATEKSE